MLNIQATIMHIMKNIYEHTTSTNRLNNIKNKSYFWTLYF